MAKTTGRRVRDNAPATYTNFGGGMEYNDHARAKISGRVGFIENLNITDDNKLELRKPAIPYITKEGDYNMPLLGPSDTIVQVFQFPALNNPTGFI